MAKVALVTGGARGIGYGISQKLADEGMNLVICGRKAESELGEQLDPLREKVEVLYCQCDISSTADRAQMIADIKAKFGKLNVLVNNAGVAPKVRTDILDATEDSFEWIMKINLQGPYFLTQAVANFMIECQKEDSEFEGCIVNVSSISAQVASVSRGDYCLSKAGVGMATQLWATRLGEFNIPVYEIRPGVIKTDMTSGVTDKYDALIEDGLCLTKRWGFPEDIGKATAVLARGEMPYSTGQVIMVDGGLTVGRL